MPVTSETVIPQLDRLLNPDMLTGLTTRPLAQLRRIRVECSQVESDISLVRRVAQGRLDIVGHESSRRSGAEGSDADTPVLFDLPEILSDGPSSTGTTPGARAVTVGEPGEVAGELVKSLDSMASPSSLSSIDSLSDGDLRELFERIRSFEVEMSSIRRQLHERIDAIQSEIGRRYRDGEASVDSILG